MGPGRWDWLYERRPVPIKEYILDKFAEEVARDIAHWPPELAGWEQPEAQKRFTPVLAGGRPSDGAVRLALLMARMDFEHREEELDQFMRAEAWKGYAPTPAEFEAAMFLHRYVSDRALALKDHAEGADLRYADLAELMGRIERKLFRVTLS